MTDDPTILRPIAVERDGRKYHAVQLSEDLSIGGLVIAAPAWLVCDPILPGRTVMIREVLKPAEFERSYGRRPATIADLQAVEYAIRWEIERRDVERMDRECRAKDNRRDDDVE